MKCFDHILLLTLYFHPSSPAGFHSQIVSHFHTCAVSMIPM
jgi:hypothetical protein